MCLASPSSRLSLFQLSCVYMVRVCVCAGTGAHAREDPRLVKEIILDCSSISFTATGSLNQTQSLPGGSRAPSLSELELRADCLHSVTLVLGIGTLFLTIVLYPWAITLANQRDPLLCGHQVAQSQCHMYIFSCPLPCPIFPRLFWFGAAFIRLWFPGFCLTASSSHCTKHPFIGYVQRG